VKWIIYEKKKSEREREKEYRIDSTLCELISAAATTTTATAEE
jgi:hypothetical protein